MDELADLGTALTDRIAELKCFVHLRLEDDSKELFNKDLVGLEASVRALEDQVASLKAYVQSELLAVPKVEALIRASRDQSQRLNTISANLPARLPRPVISSVQGVSFGHGRIATAAAVPLDAAHAGGKASGAAAAPSANEDANRRRREVPRWYVTEREFEATSSYLRGRLQPDKVNAALDELAGHALNNSKLIAAVKGGSAKLTSADRKRATELLHSVALKDGVKGHYWFLELDLREGVSIKLDKTGKSLLTLLRHLGRLQEVRCNIEGTGTTVYVLAEDMRRAGP